MTGELWTPQGRFLQKQRATSATALSSPSVSRLTPPHGSHCEPGPRSRI